MATSVSPLRQGLHCIVQHRGTIANEVMSIVIQVFLFLVITTIGMRLSNLVNEEIDPTGTIEGAVTILTGTAIKSVTEKTAQLTSNYNFSLSSPLALLGSGFVGVMQPVCSNFRFMGKLFGEFLADRVQVVLSRKKHPLFYSGAMGSTVSQVLTPERVKTIRHYSSNTVFKTIIIGTILTLVAYFVSSSSKQAQQIEDTRQRRN